VAWKILRIMKRLMPQVIPRLTFSPADWRICPRQIFIAITPSNWGLCLIWVVTFSVAAPHLLSRTKSSPSYSVLQVASVSLVAPPPRNLGRLLALRTEFRRPAASPYRRPQRITPTSMKSANSTGGLFSDCLSHPR
jgi:hypothetical protein